MKTISYRQIKTSVAGFFAVAAPLALGVFGGGLLTSCEDFFDQESDHVIYDHQLDNAVDTLYSVTGILSKLQAIGDRTVLFGEVRGDLVDVTSTADADLRDLALFNVDDDNVYNSPRDYYAVINNCNYFIAHADTALRNSRNDYVFMREYAAVKCIRAWTYLQLVLNYGSVPFVTEPILSMESAELSYPRKTLEEVCQYFIDDLSQLTGTYVSEAFDITTEMPRYGKMLSVDSRYFFFPMSILMGDLHLWLASATQNTGLYRQAALWYYNYISRRNGEHVAYPTGTNRCFWPLGTSSYLSWMDNLVIPVFSASAEESYNRDSELITVIPGDSLPSDPNYSQLRDLFNTSTTNDYQVSIVPSKGLMDLSAAQKYCNMNESGTLVTYVPSNLRDNLAGDLRLRSVWSKVENSVVEDGTRTVTEQLNRKYQSRNIRVQRRQMVYLRMAEALNMAGFPRMAFQILSTGLTDRVMADSVYPRVSKEDSLKMVALNISFPGNYIMFSVDHLTGKQIDGNTMGIHSRGSGYTPMNAYYQLVDSVPDPADPTKNVAVPLAEQQAFVDSLILNEGALEFAFEGTRYYDLMRYAMRQTNPGATLEKLVTRRHGEDGRAEVKGELKRDLTNRNNWFMSWKGQIGF